MSESTPQPGGTGAPEPTPTPLPVPPLPVPSPPALPPALGDKLARWFPEGSGFRSARDMILFIIGIGVIGQQVYWADEINSIIVGIGATMAGLPIVFRADRSSK